MTGHNASMSLTSCATGVVLMMPWTCEKSIIIQSTPGQLWQILSDIGSWSTWDPLVVSAALDDPNEPICNGATAFYNTDTYSVDLTFADLKPQQYFAYDVSHTVVMAHHFWDMSQKVPDKPEFKLVMGVVVTGAFASGYRYYYQKQVEERLEACLASIKDHLESPMNRITASVQTEMDGRRSDDQATTTLQYTPVATRMSKHTNDSA
eukprot:jgi/Hompol1/6580/HPOL_000446-RA